MQTEPISKITNEKKDKALVNIFGFFTKFELVEFRTKWIRIKRGPSVFLFTQI